MPSADFADSGYYYDYCKMSSGGDYDVVTEIWSDNILQLAKLSVDDEESEDEESPCFTDEFVAKIDGKHEFKLFIENHHKSTRELVGLQVWRAGLYLADYILENAANFANRTVLEMAAGTGLLSLVVASNHIRPKHVICTDMDKGDILPQIKRNIKLNEDGCSGQARITVAELDFMKTLIKETIEDVDIIMAADVIYDPVVTKAFFRCLKEIVQQCLVSKQLVEVYLAMEARSRGNDLDTLKIMKEELLNFEQGVDFCDNFTLTYIKKGSFQQRFAYNSSGDMHMWKLSFTVKKNDL